MISRIWHGWITSQNADKYKALLKEEIFVGIHERRIRGFKGIQLLHRDLDHEVEFITIMRFDSLDSVREFAGEEREEGFKQFLDDKTFKPGFGMYKRPPKK